jgi:cystathionine beta-synthase
LFFRTGYEGKGCLLLFLLIIHFVFLFFEFFYRRHRGKILNNVLEFIGNTPVIRLDRIKKKEGLKCDLFAKCEFFNAGGSIKDRIALRMIEEAELDGRIVPGVTTLIEPTSGNTGIGLALAGVIKGYRVIITLPEKMSDEKVNVLKALGAEIIRTPTEAASDDPESHIGVARRLQTEIPNAVILDQYANPYNPIAHYDETAEEILDQMNHQIDMVVLGAGTGGTVSGLSRKIKQRLPNCQVVAVDPHGSSLALPESLNVRGISSYLVEGIGYDFVPQVLDRSLVDCWVKTDDKESFLMARRLIREEGLLCGGSSGSAMAAALKMARELESGQRCLVILPDSIRNYMSKFLREEWMKLKGFIGEEELDSFGRQVRLAPSDPFDRATVADLHLDPTMAFPTLSLNSTCAESVLLMQSKGFEQLPVVDVHNHVLGHVTMDQLLEKLQNQRVHGHSTIDSIMIPFQKDKQVLILSSNTPLSAFSRSFDRHPLVLVKSDQQVSVGESSIPIGKPIGPRIENIIRKSDLINYLIRHGSA